MLAQQQVELSPTLSAVAMAAALHEAALPLLRQVLDQLAAGTASETALPLLPYCGFPSPILLRELARKGRQIARFRDALDALFGA